MSYYTSVWNSASWLLFFSFWINLMEVMYNKLYLYRFHVAIITVKVQGIFSHLQKMLCIFAVMSHFISARGNHSSASCHHRLVHLSVFLSPPSWYGVPLWGDKLYGWDEVEGRAEALFQGHLFRSDKHRILVEERFSWSHRLVVSYL